MTCIRASLAVLAVIGGLVTPFLLQAAPAREALVIGNGTYGALPPVPNCLSSAHAVSAALRAAGFHVTEREDASSGGTVAAISEFSNLLSASPGAAAFVYSCGYATAFNDRPFLLPVSARITRPADVLTQGVLAKTLIDALAGAGASVVAIDLVAMPDAPGPTRLDALTQANLPDGLGLIAVSQGNPTEGPTPLAAALIAGLQGPEVQVASLLGVVKQRIGADPAVALAAQRLPITPGYLVGAPPASPPLPPPVAAVAPVAPPAAGAPDEDEMTTADRRRVQVALVRLGYYDSGIDGVFGPESRAAIRRYQHEIGAEMTGHLTAAQASRLLVSH